MEGLIVADHYHRGWSPQNIVEEFLGLTPADVYAALANYHDHREQIDRDIEENGRFVEELKRTNPPSPIQEKPDEIERESVTEGA